MHGVSDLTGYYIFQVDIIIMQQYMSADTSAEKLHHSHESTGAVQMRIKNANSPHDRHSQSKSMILSDNVKVIEPVSTALQ